jgi:antitoxin FitA
VAQLVVRNIEDGVKVRLQRRARRNGRSMEEEIRDILRNSANNDSPNPGGLGLDIARLFTKVGIDEEIPELRGHKVEPFNFRS